MLPYWGAQLAGAIAAGVTTLLLFGTRIARFEVANGLERGDPGSERSAMAFGEYFPNPAMAVDSGNDRPPLGILGAG